MSELQQRLEAGLAGRYIVERPLGEGGMAVVFLARDLRHDRAVAIKVLRPDVAAEIGAERFLREIRMAASLTHPHILPVFDSGSADGLLFYVMPNMEGHSLRDRLDTERQLALEEALRITSEVASALDYSHRQQVLHRDIKPENILLHEGSALLADFGIGKSMGGGKSTTQTGFTVGTPAYMSPEQASAERVIDGRSDLYSLGCVIYEMLTGEPPFTGWNAQAIMAKRFLSPAPSVKIMRNVPDAVDVAVSRVLALSAADRYRTGAEFGDALRAILRTGEAPALRASAEKIAAEPKAIAVLPFANMSPDPENEYFSDGMTEEIINALAKVPGVQVASRSSSFAFKGKTDINARQVGERLRVSSILEGSVRKIGIHIRLSAELVNVENGYQLWSETYDRQLEDVFAVQDEISRSIVEALKVQLGGAATTQLVAPTKNIDAYTTYLKGRYHFNKFNEQSFRKAIDLFKSAIARDPSFALAWANLAMTYIEFAEMGSIDPNVAYRAASEAAAKAVSLDPDLGVAHTAMGYVKFAHDYDWAGAEKELKRGIELNPGAADAFNFYGRFCASVGRYDEAVSLNRRARELDPIAHMLDAVTALLRAGRYDEAILEAKDVREYDPEYDRAMATLGWAYFLSGRHDEGIAELESAVAASPENTTWLGQLGEAYALAGRKEKAEEVLRTLQERSAKGLVSPYHFAYVYVGLGEYDKAIDYLEQAVERRTGPTYGISGSFLLAPLRSCPRFRALLGKMNLDS
jgi:serine/threonine protein kinase